MESGYFLFNFSVLLLKLTMATFIGDFQCKVDVKGRIILPVALKKQMPPEAQDHFVVRKDIFENCLVLYSSDDWNNQLERLRKKINPYNREHNLFMRNFFKGTLELTIDTSNRILIPRRMLDLISADRDVVLLGQEGKIEIWALESFGQIDMVPDDFADLAEKLLGGKINEPLG